MFDYFSQIALIVGFVVLVISYRWFRRPTNFPPGPRGFPIFGVLPFLGKYPERIMKNWSKTYGPIMSVRMGFEDVVVLNDFPSIHEAFVKQHTKFSGRPLIPFFHQLNKGYGLAFMDYSERFKTQRKFGITTLRGFGFGKRGMEDRVIEETSCMYETIKSENGKPFDISVLLHNAVSNIICGLVLGKRFQYDDERFTNIMRMMLNRTNDPITSFITGLFVFIPFLMKVPLLSIYNQRHVKNIQTSIDLLLDHVKEHEEKFDEENVRDFIDAFLVEMKKNEDSSFTHFQLVCYLRSLFEAGTDTTSTTLNWSLLCLIHYPETQDKLYKEVMEIIGSSGKISTSKRADMPYTNAFIEEVCRFRTLLPLGVPHKVSEDAQLNGYLIPKGTRVLSNLWAVHNDSKCWKNPKQFRPERFLDEEGNFVRSNNLTTFSMGPRHCMGEQLARMELFIVLVGMIQKFQFLPDPSADKLPDIENGSNGFVFVPLPYKLVANER